MSAAVEQIPPSAAGAAAVLTTIDLEANIAPGGAAAAASSAREHGEAAAAAAVVVVDIESGTAAASPPEGSSPPGRPTPGVFAHGDALALLLGLVSVVCLTIVTGGLLNGETPSPISASLCLLCAVSCVAVLRRQRPAAAASRALEHPSTVLSTSHHPRPPSTLDHEARRSLFDYFVFSHPATTDRQEHGDDIKDSSGRSRSNEVRDVKEEEASAITTITTTTVSVVAAATAGAVAVDGKVPPSEEEIGMPRRTPEDWTTAAACVVCFGEYAPGESLCRLPCRHTYHAKCIDQWLDKANHPCCPMCKADLLALRHGSSSGGGGTMATTAIDTANTTTTPTSTTTNTNNSNNNSNSSEIPQHAADLQEESTGST